MSYDTLLAKRRKYYCYSAARSFVRGAVPCSLLSLRVHHITNRSRVAYKSLTFAAVLTVRVDLQRRHPLSLGKSFFFFFHPPADGAK